MLTLKDKEVLFDLENYQALKMELNYMDELMKECNPSLYSQTAVYQKSGYRERIKARMEEVYRRIEKCDPVHRDFLTARYIKNMNYLQIATRLNYSVSYCQGVLKRNSFKEYLKA